MTPCPVLHPQDRGVIWAVEGTHCDSPSKPQIQSGGEPFLWSLWACPPPGTPPQASVRPISSPLRAEGKSIWRQRAWDGCTVFGSVGEVTAGVVIFLQFLSPTRHLLACFEEMLI